MNSLATYLALRKVLYKIYSDEPLNLGEKILLVGFEQDILQLVRDEFYSKEED